jgi:hypothetical protein
MVIAMNELGFKIGFVLVIPVLAQAQNWKTNHLFQPSHFESALQIGEKQSWRTSPLPNSQYERKLEGEQGKQRPGLG